MPSTYTLNNGIELIATGEQSGTWGDTTNTNLELLDTALDGQVTVTLASAGTSGSPNTLPISDGAASNGRNRLVIFNDGGDLGATAYVQLTPNDAEKIIYVRNSLSGSRSILLFQGTYNASNDYEIPAGTTAIVYFNGGGTGAVAANVFNNAYFDSLRLGSVSVTAILDEDNMASDSATALATQQSIKAYVDSQVGTVDTLAEILANGNTTGGTDIVVSVDDVISLDNGTNALPSLTTTGDLNTGIYFPAADKIAITTGGTERVIVDSSGNVGIGTSSPDSPLEVVATNDAMKISGTGVSSTGLVFETNGVERKQIGIPSGDTALAFYSDAGSTEAMRIDSSGNLLVGKTSASVAVEGAELRPTGQAILVADGTNPILMNRLTSDGDIAVFRKDGTTVGSIGTNTNGNFQLYGAAASHVGLQFGSPSILPINNSGASADNAVDLGDSNVRFKDLYLSNAVKVITATNGTSIIDLGDTADNDIGRIAYDNSVNAMYFKTNNSEAMRIDSSGNVGIGTSSPSSVIDARQTSTGSSTQIRVYNTDNSNTTTQTAALFLSPDSRGNGALIFAEKENADFSTSAGRDISLVFSPVLNNTQTERMRIDSSGKVGIGATSPQQLLHINGGAADTAFQITNSASGSTATDGFSITVENPTPDVVLRNRESSNMRFLTSNTERMRIDSSGNVGIGTSSPSKKLDVDTTMRVINAAGSAAAELDITSGGTWRLRSNPTSGTNAYGLDFIKGSAGTDVKLSIDSSGNLLVGKTAESGNTAGHFFSPTGYQRSTRNGGIQILNRITTDGSIIDFQKDGSAVGSIACRSSGGNLQIHTNQSGIDFAGDGYLPMRGSSITDNSLDIGSSSFRYQDIYATNGTIQTSDANEKQQIASLTDAEITAAKVISKLFKTFKWNDSVAEKGDAARTHTGVIAQEVEAAMTDAGLNAGDYAFFISSDWTDEETGEERNRKGIRYPQLMSFIGAATEQRLASIEARLDALEGV